MIEDNPICLSCSYNFTCDESENCEAIKKLYSFMKRLNNENKKEMLEEFKKEIDYFVSEPDEEAKNIAEKLLEKFEQEFEIINMYDISIGYVRSTEGKRKGDKLVYADCRKVNDVYSAFLPFDFIITVYERNIALLDENQLAITIFHELKHIGVGPRGLRLEEHDFEEFISVAEKFGIHWDSDDNLPSIWEVGEDE